jgi:hypothetical protein
LRLFCCCFAVVLNLFWFASGPLLPRFCVSKTKPKHDQKQAGRRPKQGQPRIQHQPAASTQSCSKAPARSVSSPGRVTYPTPSYIERKNWRNNYASGVLY